MYLWQVIAFVASNSAFSVDVTQISSDTRRVYDIVLNDMEYGMVKTSFANAPSSIIHPPSIHYLTSESLVTSGFIFIKRESGWPIPPL